MLLDQTYQFVLPPIVTHSPVLTQVNLYVSPFLTVYTASELVLAPERQLTVAESPMILQFCAALLKIPAPLLSSTLISLSLRIKASVSPSANGAARVARGRKAAAMRVINFMLAVIFVTVASISLLSAMLLVCVLLDERTGIKTGESVILMPL